MSSRRGYAVSKIFTSPRSVQLSSIVIERPRGQRLLKHLCDFRSQLVLPIGLAYSWQFETRPRRQLSVSSRQQNGKIRANFARGRCKLHAVHTRHRIIRHQQVDHPAIPKDLEGAVARVGLYYLMSQIFKHAHRAHRDKGIVVDNKNGNLPVELPVRFDRRQTLLLSRRPW